MGTRTRHQAERQSWISSSLPAWLNKDSYAKRIQPLLGSTTNAAIAIALRVSMPYAIDIRRGKRIPHPRHWEVLAKLVGVSDEK
jgi:hypothetical protein